MWWAQRAVSILDTAMKYVDSHRSELGAMQNRFDHAINNLENVHLRTWRHQQPNQRYRLRQRNYSNAQAAMLQQVSTTILAQAKQAPNPAPPYWVNELHLRII